MTVPASAAKPGGRRPSAHEKAAANQLRTLLAAHAAGTAELRIISENETKPTDVVLTPELSELLLELLRHVGRGEAVTLVSSGQQLTTQQAADILNVSRPHLIALLDKGAIAYSKVGRHRRVKANDLLDFKAARDTERNEALRELALLDADLL